MAKGRKKEMRGNTKGNEKVLVLEAVEVPTVEADGTGDTSRHLRPVRVEHRSKVVLTHEASFLMLPLLL